MEKLKYIKIEHQDGTLSENVPIGVDANNVDVGNEDLSTKLNTMTSNITLAQNAANNANERVSVNTNNINVLTSRIDNLAHLDEGSTTGDAELIDIRTGYDGTNYPSAGDAIRGSLEKISKSRCGFLKLAHPIEVSREHIGDNYIISLTIPAASKVFYMNTKYLVQEDVNVSASFNLSYAAFNLIFNKTDKSFIIQYYQTSVPDNCFIVENFDVERNSYIGGDNSLIEDVAHELAPLILGFNQPFLPTINSTTQTITFPNDTLIYGNRQAYKGGTTSVFVLNNNNRICDFSSIISTAINIWFDMKEEKLIAQPYYAILGRNKLRYALIASIRTTSKKVSISCPYVYDGLLFGENLSNYINPVAIDLNNLYDIYSEVPGYISTTGGVSVPTSINNERASDFIKIDNTKEITVLLYIPSSLLSKEDYSDSKLWAGIGLYDINKTFLERKTPSFTEYMLPSGDKIMKYVFKPTDSTEYIRVSYRRYSCINIGVFNYKVEAYISYLMSYNDFEHYIENNIESSNVFFELEQGTIGPTGVRYFQANRVRTKDFIKVGKGSKIYLRKDIWRDPSITSFSLRLYDLNKKIDLDYGDPGWLRNEQIIDHNCYIQFIMKNDSKIVTDEQLQYLHDSIVIKQVDFETEEKKEILINSIVKSINHRGYNSIAPENTLPAYKLSKQNGFQYVETDVSFTNDNIPVLLHDSTINRTARNNDGSTITDDIYINNINFEQLENYDFGIWKNEKYAGTKIPTFEQFILLCRNIGLHPYIEIKTSPVPSVEQTQILVDIVKKYNMLNNVTWISFSYDALVRIKNIIPNARLGLVAGSISDSTINNANSLKNETNEIFIDSQLNVTTEEMINKCINNNIPLEVWNVFTESDIMNTNNYISGFTADTIQADKILFENSIE